MSCVIQGYIHSLNGSSASSGTTRRRVALFYKKTNMLLTLRSLNSDRRGFEIPQLESTKLSISQSWSVYYRLIK